MCVGHCFEKTLNYSSPGHGGWGIIRIAALIPQSQQMFICPSACFRHGALGAMQHGYKDRTSYLYITPADIVVGYDNVILESADELLEKDKSIKVLFLFVPCMDDFIGTDIEAIAAEVQKNHPGVIVRACHMNPVAAETDKPPLVTTIQSMFSTIEISDGATQDAVNLCGSFAPLDKKCELFDFLRDYGVSVRQLDDYKDGTYEEFCDMGRSRYNLIMHPSGKFAADYMDTHFGTKSTTHMLTYDMDEIRADYEAWEKELTQNHEKTGKAFNLDREEQLTKAAIVQAVKALNGMPVSISNSAVLRPFNLARALLKYGFNVGEIIAQEVIPSDRDAYEYICANYPEIPITQPRHHKNAVRNNLNTHCVAIGFEGAYLRQSDYVVDLSEDEGMYGYNGVRRLMAMLEKAIVEKADLRKMIEEYGAVV